jgi:glyoxylase-like metal-dependent hydrolase (beta-lactamase superfamily II)
MPAAAIQLAPNVWRVPTVFWDLVNTMVFKEDDGRVTLVDTGIKTAPGRILAALQQIGSGPADVTRIVLTHAHGDHAGGVAALRQQTGAAVLVHVEDAPSGPVRPPTWTGPCCSAACCAPGASSVRPR